MSALPEIEFHARSQWLRTSRICTPRQHVAALVKPDTVACVSPTTSIGKVLLAIGVALLLGLILNARSIVHDAAGMPDGQMRDATLYFGDKALAFAEATHLTWPRDEIDSLLGNDPQPSVPPLLQVGAIESPIAIDTPVPSPTNGTVALRVVPAAQGNATATKIVMESATPSTSVEKAPSGTSAAQLGAPLSPSSTPVPQLSGTVVSTIYRSLDTAPTKLAPTVTPAPCTSSVASGGRCGSSAQLVQVRQGSASCSAKSVSAACSHESVRAPRPATGRARAKSDPVRSAARPAATATAEPAPRKITASQPLRLLVTGDSLSGYLGPELVNDAAAVGPVMGYVDTHNGTGLTRPDYVDWSLVAQQQVAEYHPDAVVVIMGGNDFQNMTLPNGAFFTAGTPAWTKEYERRAEICMRIWTQGGTKRVYWLSMPPARDSDWAYDDNQINIALKAAAAHVPGATYLNILGPVTDHGKYVDFVRWQGQWLLIREPDGVHLNAEGSSIVADEVLQVLRHVWHLG